VLINSVCNQIAWFFNYFFIQYSLTLSTNKFNIVDLSICLRILSKLFLEGRRMSFKSSENIYCCQFKVDCYGRTFKPFLMTWRKYCFCRSFYGGVVIFFCFVCYCVLRADWWASFVFGCITLLMLFCLELSFHAA